MLHKFRDILNFYYYCTKCSKACDWFLLMSSDLETEKLYKNPRRVYHRWIVFTRAHARIVIGWWQGLYYTWLQNIYDPAFFNFHVANIIQFDSIIHTLEGVHIPWNKNTSLARSTWQVIAEQVWLDQFLCHSHDDDNSISLDHSCANSYWYNPLSSVDEQRKIHKDPTLIKRKWFAWPSWPCVVEVAST